jgi:hypothetical protein
MERSPVTKTRGASLRIGGIAGRQAILFDLDIDTVVRAGDALCFLHLPWSEDFVLQWQLSDTRSIDHHWDDSATARENADIARHAANADTLQLTCSKPESVFAQGPKEEDAFTHKTLLKHTNLKTQF